VKTYTTSKDGSATGTVPYIGPKQNMEPWRVS